MLRVILVHPLTHIMKRFLSIIFFLFSIALSAQLQVRLKSGTYELSQGSYLNIQKTQPTYGVAFWDGPVLAEDKKALADLGIQISHYLPVNAFEVRLPAGIKASELRKAGVRAFTAWTPRMKLDGPISRGDYPGWAVLDKDLIAIQYRVTPEFTANPTWVKQSKNLGNGWYAGAVSEDRIAELALRNDVLYIQAIEEPGSPENDNSRSSSRVAFEQQNGDYTGRNVVVSVGDDGDIGPHADYKGRLTSLAGPSIGDHGDHVAGTVFGAGNIDPDGAGIATHATMIYSNYPSNLTNTDLHYTQYGIRVTNSSYSNGCNAGYTAYAQQVDKDMIDNPALVHVFSAGNSNGSNCNYGAGSQWGNITGGHKQGKNVVATANITNLDVIAGSSSRGPAADGRIKPDLAAIGTNVYSTIDPNTYGTKTGTSMAAPGVAGFFAVLHNAFDEIQGDTATGGLLKAIAMNTADDLGNNGPDFIYGYGRINARKAIKTISDTAWFSGTITTGDTNSFDITVPAGAEEVRMMLYWTDKEGSIAASQALVNNLDAEVVNLTTSNSYLPWVLDHTPNATTLNNLATRGVDSLNNAEQITLANPSAGDYRFSVYGTNVPQGPQKFYVVYYIETEEITIVTPNKEPMVPGGMQVRWDGPTTGISWEYSIDNGTTWTGLSLNPIANRPIANWSVPNVATDAAYLRVYTSTDTSVAGPFSILGQPSGLTVDWACPDSVKITANSVTSATGYTAYILGQSHMDSVFSSSSNSMVIPYQPTNATWISVSADFNGVHGKRAYAIELPAGTNACPLPRDAAMASIEGPSFVSSCQGQQLNVSVKINNPSTQILDTIAMAYSFDNTIVRDTLFAALAPYEDSLFTFTQKLTWAGTAAKSLKVWTELSGDMNALNDTLEITVDYLNSTLFSMPFLQDFDSFSTCPQSTNCGGTVCALADGWTNLTNGTQDDIDWRTNQGGTVSSGTGPASGFGGSGRYLYLEASGSCENKEALLYSPCIDLSNAIQPEFSFAYHMYGVTTGSISVDLYDGTSWTSLFSKSGDQGNAWYTEKVDLSAFAGDTVVLRISGITGGGYQSDMAIDHFMVDDLIGIPVANFTPTTSTPCLQTAIELQDLSAKSPTSWTWSITPSTFTFVNNTSANSQNPQVSFNAYGTYDITLIAANSYGSDTLIKTGEITVSPLQGLPLAESFNFTGLQDFTIVNPDGQSTWTITDVDGPTGAKTGAAYMGYFNYSSVGEVDILQSPKFDISSYTNPTLLFDLSYAPYSSQYTDELAVLVSSDCGITFDTLYYKTGADLGTSPASTSVYIPGGPNDWRTDTVDLSNLSGGDFVQVQIAGICGYGNNLYLDNLRIIDLAGTPSTAALNLPSAFCEDHPFEMELISSDTTLQGSFMLNRSGSSLSTRYQGMGPHTATLNIPVDYYLEYVYYNAYTYVADSALLITGDKLDADFSLSQSGGLTYNFTDQSTPAPTQWFWEFGDGTTSTDQNPIHTFSAGGQYQISLTITTDCGLDSTTTTFQNIGVDENGLANLLIYPNPTQELLNISLSQQETSAELILYDLQGAELQRSTLPVIGGQATIHIPTLPSGAYLLEVKTAMRDTKQTVYKL